MKSTQRVAPRMSDAAVQAKTGKAWAEWFRILDAAGAKQAERMNVYWAGATRAPRGVSRGLAQQPASVLPPACLSPGMQGAKADLRCKLESR